MTAPDLDPVIHVATRLRLVALLAALGPDDAIAFGKLQRLAELTQGNLSTHLAKLEAAGYAEVDKTFEGKRPATYVRLTAQGRAAYDAYLQNLKRIIGG
ncbi:MAG: transcriptional regulator [Bifidobacteriaceae bacterium]|jgi:DNA-binding MarR family transcriptional regulator|nr:transcriptional regulator [Bifidobacteriaceae bacterium]